MINKMKILFFTAPWEYGGEDVQNIYPLGLAYLGAVLEEKGYKVNAFNFSNKSWVKEEGNIREIIKKENPDVVGVSVMSNNRISSFRLLKMAKEINKKIVTLSGGVHTSFMYNQILENYPEVDFAVLGEAEETIVELMNAIKKKKTSNELRKIKGLAFRHKGEIIKTEVRQRIKDLDKLPIPKHEYFKDQIYRYKMAYIITSRGCPFNCKFCPSSAYWGRMVCQRSAKNVLNEIKYVIKEFPGLERIYFCDDEFILDKKRIIDLCRMILEEHINIKWECIGRATSVSDELIKWMREAGCAEISFGVESGSQKLLDNINKKVKVAEIIEAYEICHRNGLRTNVMLISGLPGENSETVKETIKLVKKVRCVGEPSILQIYPGTEIYELAKKHGLLDDNYWLTNKVIPLYTVEHTRLKLWWWSFKIGFFSHLYAKKRYCSSVYSGGITDFLNRKLLSQLKPARLRIIIKKYFLFWRG